MKCLQIEFVDAYSSVCIVCINTPGVYIEQTLSLQTEVETGNSCGTKSQLNVTMNYFTSVTGRPTISFTVTNIIMTFIFFEFLLNIYR